MVELAHHRIDCDGIELHYVSAGPSAPGRTLVFLHGFPEYWGSWRRLMQALGDGYRVIAPDLPGYNESAKPQTLEQYAVPALIKTLSTFIRQVSPDLPVTLIAHDWGGAIAWPLAAFHGDLLERLVILNAAHPCTFTREMIDNPHQRDSSRYIHDLIAPDAAEKLALRDFAYLRQLLFEGLADPKWLDEDARAGYLQAWRRPGALQAMLNYYRAMPQLAPAEEGTSGGANGPVRDRSQMRIPDIRVAVPTLVLWGERDRAFVPEVLDGLSDYVQDCRVVRFPQATHWLQHEKHAEVLAAIDAFVSG